MKYRTAPALTAPIVAAALGIPSICASTADRTLPRLIREVHPEYPQAAITDDFGGWVDVDVTMAADGSVHNVTVVETDPPPVFARAAVRAVLRRVFEPARVNGTASKLRYENTSCSNPEGRPGHVFPSRRHCAYP